MLFRPHFTKSIGRINNPTYLIKLVSRIANPTCLIKPVSRIANPTYLVKLVSRIANPTCLIKLVSRVDNPTYLVKLVSRIANPTYYQPQMDNREYYHRHLPHWQPNGATLFITTRLAGSLPAHIIESLKAEREAEIKALSSQLSQETYQEQLYLQERKAFGRWDAVLDKGTTGPTWLKKPEIAALVVEALHFRDKKIYDLITFCIMSNHAHIVFAPLQEKTGTYYSLLRIMQSLKRHTARQGNKILKREGTFWQAESYDHVIRNPPELQRIIHYVIQNPVKAGLVTDWKEWPWTYCKPEYV